MKHWWIGTISEQPCWPQARRGSWIMKQESGRWRTCKVASYLQGQSGIPEWCENTQPIALFLAGHDKEHTKSIDSKSCRSEMIKVSKSAIETLKFLKLPVLSSLSRNEVFFLREVPEPLQLHHVRGSQLHGGPHPRPCRQTHQQYPNKEAESTKPLVKKKRIRPRPDLNRMTPRRGRGSRWWVTVRVRRRRRRRPLRRRRRQSLVLSNWGANSWCLQ